MGLHHIMDLKLSITFYFIIIIILKYTVMSLIQCGADNRQQLVWYNVYELPMHGKE